ncbi:MAG: MATE family efflux transporter [Ruthenibacterium sp.]
MAAKTLANPPRFSNEMLRRLLIPLVLEQLLLVTVGMADSVMVSSVGEAAVSGVSLVDQMNLLLIQVFAALATGGAVVTSQYLGRRERENASASAKQLIYLVTLLSVVIAVVVVCLNRHILQLVFGHTDPAVMQSAETYFWLSALSYPFIAIYNAGAALFRSMGNSRISLFASVVMNVINIGGNAILIYGFHMGVAGAAIASLFSRMAAALIVLLLLRNPQNPICLAGLLRFRWVGSIQRSILRVGVPSGIENGMFQIGKLLVASLIASMGLVAMTANAVCNNVAALANVPGSAVGLAMITIIGQCIGARDYPQARYYTRKLMLIAYAGVGTISAVLFFAAPALANVYHLSAATTQLSVFALRYSCICTMLIWPMSFVLPNALRAAGDAKFTMVVSMGSMWIFRVAMSYVLGAWLGWGFFGVWVAMTIDWAVRTLFFVPRIFSDKWEKKRVIDDT